jgi:single-stranded DNA-binding protein
MQVAIVTGRVASVPEPGKTPAGYNVHKFRVAVNVRGEEPVYYTCSVFSNRYGSIMHQITVGRAITVCGNVRLNAFPSKAGKVTVSPDMDVTELDLAPVVNTTQTALAPSVETAATDDDDDDLPF